jgi:hypothetical protein
VRQRRAKKIMKMSGGKIADLSHEMIIDNGGQLPVILSRLLRIAPSLEDRHKVCPIRLGRWLAEHQSRRELPAGSRASGESALNAVSYYLLLNSNDWG